MKLRKIKVTINYNRIQLLQKNYTTIYECIHL
jgi:hypothetical protein